MPKGFSLAVNPWIYVSKFTEQGQWEGRYIEQQHGTPQEEDSMKEEQREELTIARNQIAGLPLVNYTSQYGFGVFEGLKAFPQADGGYKVFRPEQNGRRMVCTIAPK